VLFVDFIYIGTKLKPQTPMNTAKTKTETTYSPFSNLQCKVFGHKYRITRRYESNIKEFECANCKKQFTLDGYGHYTPLTPKLRRINEVYENFYTRKLAR
jgi:hypothetical protein